MQFTLFSTTILWRQCPVVSREWYSDGKHYINVQLIIIDGSITVIRCMKIMIDTSTGKIKFTDMYQSNIQSNGIYNFSVDQFEGVELFSVG